MADLSELDSNKKRAFLAAFAVCGNVTKAAEAAGINRNTHHWWLKNNPEYAELFEEAKEAAADRLEEEARRRAVEGVKEPVYYQGEVVGHKLCYSDNLLMFMLKGARPEKFRERTEITGKDGGPIELEARTPEQRQQRIAELLAKQQLPQLATPERGPFDD